MRVCATCSTALRPGAKFCTQCGTPAPSVVEAPAVMPPVVEQPVVKLPAVEQQVVKQQVVELPAVEPPVVEPATLEPAAVEPPIVEPAAVAGREVPARIPGRGRWAPPPARSRAATWTLVTGLAPFIVSVTGNLAASALGVEAVRRVQAGDEQGAWAPVLVVLAIVFVLNAALLASCGVLGSRALRETNNGITQGRPLAIAGLAVGGVNLVLWVIGLVSTVSGLDAALS